MAACAITTGGTSGTLRIDYLLGVNPVIEYHNFGDDIWIDDSATDVTWTTLTGDVTAASGCVTITEKTVDYFEITFDRLKGDVLTYTPQFDAVIVDAVITVLDNPISTKYPNASGLINEINDVLEDDNIKIVSYKVNQIEATQYYEIGFIFRIIDGGAPKLRIKSPYDNYSYLEGTSSVELPAGYATLGIPLT